MHIDRLRKIHLAQSGSEPIAPFLLGMITLHPTLYIKMGMIGRKYNNAE